MDPLKKEDLGKYSNLREIMDRNSIYRDRLLNQRAAELIEGGYEKFIIVNPGQFLLPGSLPPCESDKGKCIHSSFTASSTLLGEQLGIKTFYSASNLSEAVLICSWLKWFTDQFSNGKVDSTVLEWLKLRLFYSPHYVNQYKLYGVKNDIFTLMISTQGHFLEEQLPEVSLKNVQPFEEIWDNRILLNRNIFHDIRHATIAYRQRVNDELAKEDPSTRLTWSIAKLKG